MAEAQDTSPIFSVEGISVSAGGRRLVKGLSFAVTRGKRVGLFGPSGCGKSTLLRSLCGLDSPSAGTVTLAGAVPEGVGWPAFRRRVVLAQQQPVLFDGSVEKNLARVFAYRTADRPFPRDEAAALLDRLQLECAYPLEQSARALSVGEQQRVCLVRALLVSPNVLLLDEPTSALDAAAAESVETLVNEACGKGMAAVIVSHSEAQMTRWCHRVVPLGDSRAEASAL